MESISRWSVAFLPMGGQQVNIVTTSDGNNFAAILGHLTWRYNGGGIPPHTRRYQGELAGCTTDGKDHQYALWHWPCK